MVHDLEPIAFIAAGQFAIHLAARGAEIAFHLDVIGWITAVAHQFIDYLRSLFGRNQVERFLAHRAWQFVVHQGENFLFNVVGNVCPGKRVHRALGCARILFESFLQEPHNRALGAADRPVEQDDPPLRAVIS